MSFREPFAQINKTAALAAERAPVLLGCPGYGFAAGGAGNVARTLAHEILGRGSRAGFKPAPTEIASNNAAHQIEFDILLGLRGA